MTLLIQVSGNSRGNSTSRASAGKRRDTAVLGVSESSSPAAMTSARTRRAVRSGRPVMWAWMSPRSNSPRISASSKSREGFRFEGRTLYIGSQPRSQTVDLEKVAHEFHLVETYLKKP